MQSDWTRTFFSGFILDIFPMMTTKEQTRDEADFLVRVLAPAAGARILDAPCGNGRLTLPLAERGFRMTGVDGTALLLDEARRNTGDRPAIFDQRDMRALALSNAFDYAFCFGNSFAYFDDAGNQAFLSGVARALKPGGKFVLQTNLAAEGIFQQALSTRWMKLGDMYFLHETKYDPIPATLTSGYTLILGSQVERKEAVYQIYLCRQIIEMLRTAGFTAIETYGSMTLEAYQAGSRDLFLVATR